MYVVGYDIVDAFMSSRTDEVLYLFLGCILWMLQKKAVLGEAMGGYESETELLCPKNPCTFTKGRTERRTPVKGATQIGSALGAAATMVGEVSKTASNPCSFEKVQRRRTPSWSAAFVAT